MINEIAEIEHAYLDLLYNSSLKYMEKVTEYVNIDDSDINLEFDIQTWAH